MNLFTCVAGLFFPLRAPSPPAGVRMYFLWPGGRGRLASPEGKLMGAGVVTTCKLCCGFAACCAVLTVGRPRPSRLSADCSEHATHTTEYCMDQRLPRCLYSRILRESLFAKFANVNTSRFHSSPPRV